MIVYIILLCLHTCHCITVTRGELFDTARGGIICRNICTCQSPTTYFNLPGEEKCIGANGTGCSLKVNGYTNDVPLITQSMLNKTEFRITKDGGNLCPSTLFTFEASSVKILALTDTWEVVPTFMSNSILYSIRNIKEVTVTFQAVWSGLLIKLIVNCKASDGKEYTPRENCILFKYEGKATYPLTLSLFRPKWATTKTPLTQLTTTTPKTATANLKQKATGSLSSVLKTSTTPRTDANSNEFDLSTLSCEYNKTVVIVGAILGAVNIILIIIVIIFIHEVKKWDKRRIKQSTGDLNLAESSFGYEVTIHDTASGEKQGETNQSCQNPVDNTNYTPLIFDSKENGESNYTALSKNGKESS